MVNFKRFLLLGIGGFLCFQLAGCGKRGTLVAPDKEETVFVYPKT